MAIATRLERTGTVPAALLIALAILVAASIPLLSPDSFYYADTAHHLAEGRGPVTYALHLGMRSVPSPAGFWPTLYPNALRLAEAAGSPSDRAPAAVNAVALVALGLVLVRIGRRSLPAGWAWPVALLAVAHPFYADVLAFAWSEALFMAFAYAALAVLLGSAGEARVPIGRCAAAGALAGAAFATRYAGIFLLGYLLVAGAVVARRNRWAPARAAAGCVALLAAFAFLAVPAVLPNLRAYGSPFGMPRLPEPSLARAALARTREIVAAGGLLWLEAATLVAIAIALALLARRRAERDGEQPVGDRPRVISSLSPRSAGGEGQGEGGAGTREVWLLAGWIAFYACALFVSLVPYARGDPLEGRFLAPIAPAAVLVLAAWLTRGRHAPRFAAGAAALLAVATFVHAGHRYRIGVPQADPLVTWSKSHASAQSVFVGGELWELPHRTGAIVLTDGYPEMPSLAPDRVRDFLRAQGAGFRTVHLVFGGATGLKTVSALAYERAMRDIGFRSRLRERLDDGSVVVTLAR